MSEVVNTATVSPVDEQIQQELVKHNVTETIISNLREKYLPLKINGIEDKETYLKVKEARKECKALRVLAKKICVAGRDEANKIQKAWVAKENDITGRIGEVEEYLQAQEDDYDSKVAAEKERQKREQEEQFILRNQVLSGMNVLYSEGHYTLGEVSFEMSLIKECDPDIWENDIKPKFEAEYKIVQAAILEQERIKQEKEAEFQRQQEEFERKQRELEAKEAALKAAQEEQERKEREEHDRKIAAAKAEEEAKWKVRADQLQALGLKIEFFNNHLYYNGYDCSISHLDITGYSDEKWNEMIEKITPHIAGMKALEEQKRQAEIEAQKEAERKKILGKSRFDMISQYVDVKDIPDLRELAEMPEDDFTDWQTCAKADFEKKQREKWEKEQEEKRQKEEAERLAKLEAAKDKEKWDEMVKQVNAIELYDMRSSQYRTKAQKFRQKLDELKAICNG